MRFRMKRNVGDNTVGKHRMVIDGKMTIVRPGNVIDVKPESLKGFMDKFEALDSQAEENKDLKPTEKLVMRNRPNSPVWFDVINTATGEPINTKALKKDEALALIEEMKAAESESGDGDSDSSSGPDSSSGGGGE